ncbi:MAG: DUF429 domain-containing protein [Desulfurococcales archaeon]|nr:DUF429 domain-containing protein [Desulfurococcales archaeon]
MPVIVSGIDLSANPRKRSGICIIANGVLSSCIKKPKDSEIIDFIYSMGKPRVVAIDAPLSIVDKGFRDVERLLIKDGFKLLPLGLEGMKRLAERAIRLKNIFEKEGITALETHPRSAFISAGCYWENISFTGCLARYVKLESNLNLKNKDIRDAAIAACVAWMYLNKKTLAYKSSGDSIYLLPRLNTKI